MIITLDLTPEQELALARKAERQGLDVQGYLQHMVEKAVMPRTQRRIDAEEAKRLAAVEKAYGMTAGLPGSVEEFLQRKHEDNEREEARLDERHRAV